MRDIGFSSSSKWMKTWAIHFQMFVVRHLWLGLCIQNCLIFKIFALHPFYRVFFPKRKYNGPSLWWILFPVIIDHRHIFINFSLIRNVFRAIFKISSGKRFFLIIVHCSIGSQFYKSEKFHISQPSNYPKAYIGSHSNEGNSRRVGGWVEIRPRS